MDSRTGNKKFENTIKYDYKRTKTKEGVKVKKEKFCPVCNEEAETHIWADFCVGQVFMSQNKLVIFAMAKPMEMDTTEQNKIALYLFNNIKI